MIILFLRGVYVQAAVPQMASRQHCIGRRDTGLKKTPFGLRRFVFDLPPTFLSALWLSSEEVADFHQTGGSDSSQPSPAAASRAGAGWDRGYLQIRLSVLLRLDTLEL